MKITKIFAAIAVLFATVACNPDNKGGNNGGSNNDWSNTGSPIGEWMLTEWNGSNELPMGVYLRLNEDNSFELYQHTFSVLWVRYSGTFSLNDGILTGRYSDGSDWNEYVIRYNDKAEPKQIKLTRTGDSTDVAIYTATEIPASVTDQASEAENVRSVTIEKFL